MEYLVFTIILAALLRESHLLNPEIMKYDQFLKDFEATGRALKQEGVKKKMDGSILKRENTQIPASGTLPTVATEMPVTTRPNEEENLLEWCRDWLNYSIEVQKPEYGNVKSFCERILMSDNDADRFLAQQYLASLYRDVRRLDVVMANIVMRLSGYNETKKEYLMNKTYKIPIQLGECYWTVHEAFRIFCIDPELNKYVRTYRHIFAHACKARWLTIKDVIECFEDVCRDIKLFKDLPFPPEFLYGLDGKT